MPGGSTGLRNHKHFLLNVKNENTELQTRCQNQEGGCGTANGFVAWKGLGSRPINVTNPFAVPQTRVRQRPWARKKCFIPQTHLGVSCVFSCSSFLLKQW